jgi:hypothetical protein
MAERSGQGQGQGQGQNRCNECGQSFNSSNELREHQKNNHQSSQQRDK